MPLSVFVTAYHNSVNPTLFEDLSSIGLKVYAPDHTWGKRIWFFAPNDPFKKHATLVSYEQFLKLPPLAIIYPCNQHLSDFNQLYQNRGCKDVKVHLTAQSITAYPHDEVEFLLTHDVDFHRLSSAHTKMIYFSPPKIYYPQDRDIRRAYDSKIVRLFINNFRGEGFEPEYEAAKQFREHWLAKGGRGGEFFGYDNEDGMLSEHGVQEHIRDSQYVISFKRRETMAQVATASMLYGVPLLMLNKFRNNLTKFYIVTEDNTLIAETVEELVDRALNMTFEEYESLSWSARTMASMYALDEPRRTQLRWFFSKVQERLKDKGGGV